MEREAAPKRSELSNRGKTRRNLKLTALSKRSQPGKAAYCMLPIIQQSGKERTVETEKRSGVARQRGEGRGQQEERRGFGGQGKYLG